MSTAHSPQLLFGVAEAELAFTFRILSAAGVREEAGKSLHGVTVTISGSFYESGKALHTPQAQGFPVSSVGSLQRLEERRNHSTLKILTIGMALASQQCFYIQ